MSTKSYFVRFTGVIQPPVPGHKLCIFKTPGPLSTMESQISRGVLDRTVGPRLRVRPVLFLTWVAVKCMPGVMIARNSKQFLPRGQVTRRSN
jgi:hypothetical protein